VLSAQCSELGDRKQDNASDTDTRTLYPSRHYPVPRALKKKGAVMRLINNKIRNQKLNECPFVVTPTMTPKEVSFGGWGLMTMIMMMTGSRPTPPETVTASVSVPLSVSVSAVASRVRDDGCDDVDGAMTAKRALSAADGCHIP